MISTSYPNNSFLFRAQELAGKLCQASENKPAGYWQIQINSAEKPTAQQFWYLALVQNRIVFSGVGTLNWLAGNLNWLGLLEILQRHIPNLRSASVQQQLQAIDQELGLEQRASPLILLNQMVVKELLDYADAQRAMQLRVLTDFDTYLFDYAGRAQFVPDAQLLGWPSLPGLELDGLLAEAKQRRLQWTKLEAFVPSIEAVPQLDREAVERQNVLPRHKQQLQQLTSQGKTIREIASYLGQDPLQVAKILMRLVQNGLVTFAPVRRQQASKPLTPEIFIIDDSPLMLQNFKALVTKLGYRVRCCSDALAAVPTMLADQPAAIFVDVNMPRLSGFQLIKQIRLQPELTAVPLIVLTAEKSLSNQMRAKWSRSQFLTKPLNSKEIPTFCSQLCSLLQEIVPLSSPASSPDSSRETSPKS